MASKRRDSLANMDKRLKALSKKLPDSNDQFTVLIALGDPEQLPAATDRAAALVAAQFVEHALEKSIATHLANGFDEKEIFEGPGAPLGTFSAKIAMAAALGIIQRAEREDLDTIRNIRNAFAHSMTHISFDDKPVIDLVDALQGYEAAPITLDMREIAGPKKVFVVIASMLYFGLITHFPGADFQAIWSPQLP